MSEVQNEKNGQKDDSAKANGKFLIIFGSLPYIIVLITAIDAMINGYAVPFFGNQTKSYGFDSGMTVLIFSIIAYWPFFLIATIMIIAGIVIVLKNKK